MKFRQIGHTTSQYGQSFFTKTITAWNGVSFVEAPSSAVFRSNSLPHNTLEGPDQYRNRSHHMPAAVRRSVSLLVEGLSCNCIHGGKSQSH